VAHDADDAIQHSAEARRDQLARLRTVSPGALWTRATFAGEFGEPIDARDPEAVELVGRDAENGCPYCQGEQFIRETYLTDRPGVHVVFWWCNGCSLGRAVGWDAE
jgi:hypothetical protein